MTAPIPGLPTTRPEGCPFDPPAELAELRPLTRMVYPDGHVGWLTTSHELVRAVLADSRFSARYELMHYPFPGGPDEIPPAMPGDLTGIDAPEHTRFRELLAGRFTVRRMRLLTERVAEICAEQLDTMAQQGPPTDLVTAYAQPVPALTICELLGVPYADHEFFQRTVRTLTSTSAGMEDQGAALTALYEYLHELVLAKRRSPTDDLLSDLTTSDLDDVELSGLGTFLLGAGMDTTANMIALGTFALLTNPDQLGELRDGWSTVDEAVEELLRYLSIAHTGARAALTDVELGGELVRAGETVTVSLQAANRDPARFPDPDTLDLTRHAAGHVALGHGIHQCLGQQLARVEMRVAFPALLKRFPTLRLAVDAADVPLRTDSNIHGVHGLPVTW
ncbi:cytochrome P450 [Actinophytocola oryzae]|uniref:Cytochrome P450 n=1 Tax=Actinophytocola oryzae TaxID=502181 RepID=A0A4R7W3C8_9PSEU|nr:cytochrome P450 [Actinophytocola oryzae]TDV56548.1 cytochrome P450 [Actinophytocola oryzae]